MSKTLKIFGQTYPNVNTIYVEDNSGVQHAFIDADNKALEQEEKDVNFIDYDGTILYSYTAAQAQAMSELPANPTHPGLTSQGWNWTLAQIKAQLTAMPGIPVWVGQMYVTTSGDTEIDIILNNNECLSPYLTLAVNGTMSVDWGDGSTADTMTGNSLTNNIFQQHIYASTGNYTIKITPVSGSFSFYSTNSSYVGVMRISNSSGNRPMSEAYSSAIIAIRMGNSANISTSSFVRCISLKTITIPSTASISGGYLFRYCYSLKSITLPPNSLTALPNYPFTYCASLERISLPSGITSFSSSSFSYCYSLKNITIQNSVTEFGSSTFVDCYNLNKFTIPNEITAIPNSLLSSCRSLIKLTIPSNITTIGNSAFYSCYGICEYHFTKTTVPTLSNTNAFSGISEGTKIYVPYSADHSILNAYKTADNWSTYATYIEEEPQ